MQHQNTIAYFTMEIGLHPQMPTYSGGLGVLAGDTVKSAADLKVPMVGVCLIHSRGCFVQKLDEKGRQTEDPADWKKEDFVEPQYPRVMIRLEGRTVHLRAWRYDVKGVDGWVVPVFFIDSDLPENSPYDRELTHFLYGGDQRYRICQEWILGVGGVKLLRALGYEDIKIFHMNEGHASFLTFELLNEELRNHHRTMPAMEDIEAVRHKCIFTTHTPVPAGHDRFPMDLVNHTLGHDETIKLKSVLNCDNALNMTHLALRFSRYVNGVAKKHGEVSRKMFNNNGIQWITNGVHAPSWVSDPMQKLFDKYLPEWRHDSFILRNACAIPHQEIWDAHQVSKKELIAKVNAVTKQGLKDDVYTIGFARRAASYKRADLLFFDIERLKKIYKEQGPFQLIYAGKAHPRDMDGKALIQRIFDSIGTLKNDIKIAYIPNYDMTWGKLITSGVDVWLNTPQPPLEASGTSGMKAAMNGVPNFSSLDGWWIEGCVEGVTGWAIGTDGHDVNEHREYATDAKLLYDKLENIILPMYYKNRDEYIHIMSQAIGINGSYFNTHRMVEDYVLYAYFTREGREFKW